MSRLAVAVLLTIPLVASSEPPRAEGRIEAGDARVEILGRPYRVGETIQLPEGYLRVEEAGPEDEEVGSFTVVPASEPTSLAAAVARGSPGGAAASAAAGRDPLPRRARGVPRGDLEGLRHRGPGPGGPPRGVRGCGG